MILRVLSIAIAVVAAIAFAAVPATSALGAEFSGGGTVSGAKALSAIQFEFGETTVKCKAVGGTGSYSASSLTFVPTWSECEFGTGASVTNEGCALLFDEPEGAEPPFSGSVSIVNQPGTEGCRFNLYSEFLGVGCHVYLGPQGPLRTVALEEAGPESLLVILKLTGVAFTSEGSGCSLAGVPSEGTASISGEVLIDGVTIA